MMLTRAAILAFACQGACSLMPEDPLPELPIELSDDARLPEEQAGIESVEVGPTSLVFTLSSSPEDFEIEPGTVVVGELGGGYLRRVVSVERGATQVEATTEQASLTDVFTKGALAGALVSAGSDGWQDGCPRGATCKQVSLIDLSGTKLYEGDSGGVPLVVEVVSGSITFNPQVDVDFEIKGGKLARFEAIAGGTLVVVFEVKITAGGALNFAEELDISGPDNVLYSHPFTFVIPTLIGPLPVVGRIDLDVFAGFNAELFAQTAVLTGFESNASLDVGARYDGTEWTLVGDPAITATALPVTFEGDGSADIVAYVRPEIRSIFYGVGGPGITLTPQLRLNGGHVPPAAPAGTVDGCLEAELNFVLKVFSFELADYSNSIERCERLFEGEFGFTERNPDNE